MTLLTFHPIEVMTDGGYRDGRLALANGRLVAVLVHLMPEETAGGRGEGREAWYQEAGFGPCSSLVTPPPPMFDSLEEARGWIDERMSGGGGASRSF